MINQVSVWFFWGLLSLVASDELRPAGRDHAVTKPLPRLSEYQFFRKPLAALNPMPEVIEYEVNAALFSNYAWKARFLRLPEGSAMEFRHQESFDFPVGTVLIKNFYFPVDFRNEKLGRHLIETRLLLLDEEGWQAYPYIWNAEQTDAFYDPAGGKTEISYQDERGKKVTAPYLIPNKNQCKSCHAKAQALVPIGPTARQLNRTGSNGKNQLVDWQASGLLKGMPQMEMIEKMPDYEDPSANLNTRARAYLDSNCGHCHRADGPANTSGLFLDFHEENSTHLGINKTPVAAGRGSGDLPFDIMPGDPKKSILLFRMKTNDPGIAMPEVGREQVHKEGIELIAAWIKEMPR